MNTICVVEDEVKVAGLLYKGLSENGFEVTVVATGRQAKEVLLTQPFDLIILDLMLPDMNGRQLCRDIREEDEFTPIMMLTALGQVENKVSGLQAGADDYLSKPFHFDELLARIYALLRRKQLNMPQQREWLIFADLRLNTFTKQAERKGTKITLTSKEYQLLELFMRNPNRTLSRQQIAEQVWEINFDTGTNFIDVYINYLRNKIEKGLGGKLIHAVVGMGYILKESDQ
ncbi:MAG TPA: response regulator transcription factor [Mucilaginibacter sp.]|jgi:two-component system copper resistance phosphate regulon response regulator CusR|nr:response regulator transcription factor [Mucilaginibacter sp.]